MPLDDALLYCVWLLTLKGSLALFSVGYIYMYCDTQYIAFCVIDAICGLALS